MDLVSALAEVFAPAPRYEQKGVRPQDLIPAWQSDQPESREWDDRKAVTEGLQSSPWVARCVRARARALASLPLVTFSLEDDAWVPRPEHKLTRLVESPNNFMSRADVIERSSMQLDLSGNFVWQMVRRGDVTPVTSKTSLKRRLKEIAEAKAAKKIGDVIELWPLQIYPLKPIPSKEDWILGFEYREGDAYVPVLAYGDSIHHMMAGLISQHWGMGRLQAASVSVDSEIAARQWNRRQLSNRGVPDGVIELPIDIGDEQFRQAEAALKRQGGQRKGAWIVPGTFKPLSLSPVDMDWAAGLGRSALEICAAFDTPPPVAGIMENATLANVDTLIAAWWEGSVLVDADAIEMTLNRTLTPEFGPTPGRMDKKMSSLPRRALSSGFRRELKQWIKDGGRDKLLAKHAKAASNGLDDSSPIWLGFDATNIPALQAKFKEKIEQVKSMVACGIALNDAIARVDLGIDDQIGGDVPRVPSNTVEVTVDTEEAAAKLTAA